MATHKSGQNPVKAVTLKHVNPMGKANCHDIGVDEFVRDNMTLADRQV